ncbi:RNA polymerase sigma-70 factor, ECF subfamily [Chitinophaga terrae (ex Kim and Jung 2007)]|uniref:RNA polymerase sigma-70 factor, ECF subfamily n=1 Tax=Chitinophaga terrae (ex Kim and Jung 2007) TaxID=408074 RepID=A0A1H4ABS8_9BACT|nr:RNA polymerase sigma factor [Chitinophaga terrae (ex Kim and Jung 2007)]MDQ0105900.1 RNA polymerase sigma-70 factor (ECF subfamily) [Chitinophaga terrae (ex Kim and Jung 2007)]GEP90158.1 DNA-directed RNA polymerase sigma-70 factor [Chitinophaga terrae (ex Kim and Jung 2007)]SEA33370.1 RNA polymerase sigma-70 factor, ECF subfamily [Chitinophaga terrae (ex Kim and Jung 2007)]
MKSKEKEFLALITSNKGIIRKVSRTYMDTPDDQADLEQEIIYQLWKSFDSFQQQSSFSTWMYRVALNTALVFFKKDRRKIIVQEEPPPDMPSDENPTAVKELQLAHFYRAVQKLERIEKALVLLHLENYSHKEIGENLGISEGNARIKLSRAKEKLKTLIKQQGYEF